MAYGKLLFVLFISIINGVFSKRNSCNYGGSFEFSLHQECISKGNYVGRVNIGESFILSFDLVVNSMHGNEWVSILHIGSENHERSPGIWLSPSELTLYIILSDTDSWNTYRYITNAVTIDEQINIKLVVTSDGFVTGYLNHVEEFSYSDAVHLTRFNSPIFIGDPWYTPVDGTVKNLKIEPYDDECSTSNGPGPFEKHEKISKKEDEPVKQLVNQPAPLEDSLPSDKEEEEAIVAAPLEVEPIEVEPIDVAPLDVAPLEKEDFINNNINNEVGINKHNNNKSSSSNKFEFNWWEIIMINVIAVLLCIVVLRTFGCIKFSSFNKNVDVQYQALPNTV